MAFPLPAAASEEPSATGVALLPPRVCVEVFVEFKLEGSMDADPRLVASADILKYR